MDTNPVLSPETLPKVTYPPIPESTERINIQGGVRDFFEPRLEAYERSAI